MRRGLPIELDLPLGDPEEGELGLRRHRHLTAMPGVDDAIAGRLERAFHTLAALYAAPEEKLATVVGPVVAARIRWFLDAPLRPPSHGAPGWPRAA